MGIMEAFSLAGRKAVVTGGNRGLGRGLAVGLAEAGASVAIVGRDRERNQRTVSECGREGIALHAIEADLTRDGAPEEMIAEAANWLGGIDILVNNAGWAFSEPAATVRAEQWSAVFDLNVWSLWRCAVAASATMSAGGSIVNIGSVSGLRVNRYGPQAPYAATKAAVHQLTRSLAFEWAPAGIRVNAVAPGYVETDLVPVGDPAFDRSFVSATPLRRYAQPSEIAPSVVFLCSSASSFVTGAILVVDGGLTL